MSTTSVSFLFFFFFFFLQCLCNAYNTPCLKLMVVTEKLQSVLKEDHFFFFFFFFFFFLSALMYNTPCLLMVVWCTWLSVVDYSMRAG